MTGLCKLLLLLVVAGSICMFFWTGKVVSERKDIISHRIDQIEQVTE